MGPTDFILLIALAVTLAAWGIAQFLLSRFNSDKSKLQSRLSSDWRSDLDALANRSLKLSTEFDNLPPWMARSKLLRALSRKLGTAYPSASLTSFLCICGIVGLLAFMSMSLLADSLLAGVIAGVIVAYIPVFFLNGKLSHRQRILADQLPEALDFLCRILKAGHSLSTGLQMMGDELPQPIRIEFRRCYDQHSLGQALEESLRDMVSRIESPDFAFFVTAVLIQRQTGGDLSEVLGNISTMIRSRIRLQQRVKAITAEGRMTGYILFAFPAVLFAISYFLNPQYTSVMTNTDVGRLLLGLAFVLQVVGLIVIRRIVDVKA
jgi:tight adherence protein B